MKRSIIVAVALFAAVGLSARAQDAAKGKTETSLAVGLQGSKGNSDIQQGTANFLTLRKTDASECKFGFDYVYGKIGGNTTNNNVKVYTGYRHNISDRFYGLFDLTFQYDEIADLDYRVTASPGLGYYLLKSDVQTFSLEAGPSYIWEKKGGQADDYAALRFQEKYERKISATSKFWESLEYLPRIDDFNTYMLNGEAGVEAAMNTSLSLRLVLTDKYDSAPAPDRKENDVTVTGSLVYKI